MTALALTEERHARPWPRRVLHVVRQMHAGGIAVWLMNILRHIDRARYHMDFLLVHDGPAAYANEIRGLGSSITSCLGYHNPWNSPGTSLGSCAKPAPTTWSTAMLYNYSGFVLKLASRHGVPVRIAQSHTDTRLKEANQGRFRQAYRRAYLGVTRHWRATLCNGRPRCQPWRGRCAVWRRLGDGRALSRAAPRARLRAFLLSLTIKPRSARSLGLPADALVIGHVGNYVWHKNHDFLIEIAREILAKEPRAWLLLVGHGLIGSHCREAGASLGARRSGPDRGAQRRRPPAHDRRDGCVPVPLPLRGAGTCAAGGAGRGPAVHSHRQPASRGRCGAGTRSPTVPQAPPATWASAALNAAERSVGPAAAFARMAASDFAIENSVRQLTRVYDQPNRMAAWLAPWRRDADRVSGHARHRQDDLGAGPCGRPRRARLRRSLLAMDAPVNAKPLHEARAPVQRNRALWGRPAATRLYAPAQVLHIFLRRT